LSVPLKHVIVDKPSSGAGSGGGSSSGRPPAGAAGGGPMGLGALFNSGGPILRPVGASRTPSSGEFPVLFLHLWDFFFKWPENFKQCVTSVHA